MKRIILFTVLFGFCSFLIFSQFHIPENEKTNFCKDNRCGKVNGFIVDYESKEPVNEQFVVAISKCNGINVDPYWLIREAVYTDESGYFSFMFEEGDFCLIFFPVSKKSKYCGDSFPYCNPNEANHIKIRKGMVTYVKKVAKYGGRINLKFVDLNGKSVNLKNVLPEDSYITFEIKNRLVSPYYDYLFPLKKFDECFVIKNAAYNLHPGIYQGIIGFRIDYEQNIGYASQYMSEIKIEEGKITEVKVLFDRINHKTGIQGIITDENNNPIQNIRIGLHSKNIRIKDKCSPPYYIRGQSVTDNGGKFRIVGLSEKNNPYKIYLGFPWSNKKGTPDTIKNIFLKKDQIILKKIKLKINVIQKIIE